MEDKFLSDSFLSRWVRDLLSEEEEEEFNEWLQTHNEYVNLFDEIKLIWDQAGRISFPVHKKHIVWESIREKIRQTAPAAPLRYTPGRRRLLPWAIPAAAAVLIMIGLYYFLKGETITVQSLNGQITRVLLPDSSEVILNAGSQLSYPASGWKKIRKVDLQGEAYFKIRKSQSPFRVKSDFVTVEVLGTEFNVKTRQNKTEVVCSKGKVKVESEHQPDQPVYLTEGLGTYVDKRSAPVKPYRADVGKKSGWTQGEFTFEQEPLYSVFEEIGRQYNVSVSLDINNPGQKFTGRLTKKTVKETMELICLIAEIKYKSVNDSTYIIYK